MRSRDVEGFLPVFTFFLEKSDFTLFAYYFFYFALPMFLLGVLGVTMALLYVLLVFTLLHVTSWFRGLGSCMGIFQRFFSHLQGFIFGLRSSHFGFSHP